MDHPNYQTELRRVFLLADLPNPLTRASRHLQFFDNYIENTRLRLRSVRDPHSKVWTRTLEQRFPADAANDLSAWQTSEIQLNEAEYQAFERFEGREIRKNRYFYEPEEGSNAGQKFEIDVFIGPLWGLCLAKIYFETAEELQKFPTPEFAVLDVTNHKFFTGEVLVEKKFADVQAEFRALSNQEQAISKDNS